MLPDVIIATALVVLCLSVELEGRKTSYLYDSDDSASCFTFEGFNFDIMTKYNRRAYSKINEHLMKRLPDNEDAEDNLGEAINWLSTSTVVCVPFNPYPTALKQLVSLQALKKGSKCDQKELELLENVDKATKFQAKKSERFLGSARRIVKVVNKYFVNHAKACHSRYIKKFNIKYAAIKNSQIQSVEIFVNGILNGKLKSIKEKSPANWIGCQEDELKSSLEQFDAFKMRYILNVRWIYSAANLYDALLHLAKGDPNYDCLKSAYDGSSYSEMMEHIRKVEDLFNRYIIQPCKYYIEQLGTDILAPATFDSYILADEEWRNKETIIANFGFYLARANFLYCQQTVRREAELIKELVTIPPLKIQ